MVPIFKQEQGRRFTEVTVDGYITGVGKDVNSLFLKYVFMLIFELNESCRSCFNLFCFGILDMHVLTLSTVLSQAHCLMVSLVKDLLIE